MIRNVKIMTCFSKNTCLALGAILGIVSAVLTPPLIRFKSDDKKKNISEKLMVLHPKIKAPIHNARASNKDKPLIIVHHAEKNIGTNKNKDKSSSIPKNISNEKHVSKDKNDSGVIINQSIQNSRVSQESKEDSNEKFDSCISTASILELVQSKLLELGDKGWNLFLIPNPCTYDISLAFKDAYSHISSSSDPSNIVSDFQTEFISDVSEYYNFPHIRTDDALRRHSTLLEERSKHFIEESDRFNKHGTQSIKSKMKKISEMVKMPFCMKPPKKNSHKIEFSSNKEKNNNEVSIKTI